MDNNKFYELNKDRIVLHDKASDLLELRRDPVYSNQIHSDLWILRQRETLDSLGDGVLDMVRQRFSQSLPHTSPFDGFTDDEILDNIKSKGIQTAAELKNYISVLERVKSSRSALAAVAAEKFDDSEKVENHDD